MEQKQLGNIRKQTNKKKEKKKDKINTITTNQAERPHFHIMPSPKEKAFGLYLRKEKN